MTLLGKPFKVDRLDDFEEDEEMLTVETERKIKLAHGRDGKTIGQISPEF